MIRPAQVFKNIYAASPLAAPVAAQVEWTVSPDLPYLNGHFPQTPILPAIAIIDASTYLLQCALGRELTVKAIVSAKFLSPIVPGQVVRIEFEPADNGVWSLDWKEASSDRILASLSLQL